MINILNLRTIICMVIVAAFCCFVCENAVAYTEGDIHEYENFRYIIKDGKVKIIEADYTDEMAKKYNKTVIIPNRINGMKVVDVRKGAFSIGYVGLEADVSTIKCSDYMSYVHMDSFNVFRDYNVKKIILGKFTKRYDAESWYERNPIELKTIKVPKDAKYLKVTKNGALYSKDGKILYAVPSKKKGSFKISSKTKTICSNAFFCSHLDMVKIPKSVTKITEEAFAYFDTGSEKEGEYKVIKMPRNRMKKFKKIIAPVTHNLNYIKVIGY